MNTPTRGEQSTSSNHFWNYFATSFNAYLILRKFPTYNFIENFLKISRKVSLFLKVRCFDVILSRLGKFPSQIFIEIIIRLYRIIEIIPIVSYTFLHLQIFHREHSKSVRNTHNPSVHPQLFPIHAASSSNVL